LSAAPNFMLRKQTNERDPQDWFSFAEERLRGADVLWKAEGLTALGIEALQEAVERYLKGYLIARGWVLIKTHDLERLVKEASFYEGRFGQYSQLASELTEDFFAQHYPGQDTSNVGIHYEQMRRQVDQLLQMIKETLPAYFRPTTPKPNE